MADVLNTIKVTNKQAKSTILACVEARLPILIHGAPGIGKSQLIKQIAEETGRELIDLRLAQFPPEDLAGIPVPEKIFKKVIDENGNKVDDKSHFKFKTYRSLPDYLPRKGTGILFLDEINQANPSVLNAIFQLVLDGELCGGAYKLPEGWTIVAACNDRDYNPDVTEFNSPINDRFIHILMECDKKVWLTWAKQNSIHPRIINFIDNAKENLLCDTDENMQEKIIFSSPRSWERLSLFEYKFDAKCIDLNTLQILVNGIIGNENANQYWEATLGSRIDLSQKLGYDIKPYTDLLYNGDTSKPIDNNLFDKTIEPRTHLDRIIQVKNETANDHSKKEVKNAIFMLTKYAIEITHYKTEELESLVQIAYDKDWTQISDVHKNNPELWNYIVEYSRNNTDYLKKCGDLK